MIEFLKKIRYQFEQFKLLIKGKGLKLALKDAFYINREMILVERELDKPLPKMKKFIDLKLVLLNKGDIEKIKNYEFADKVRKLKSKNYLSKGYNGFFMIKNNKIIAEQWWVSKKINKRGIPHPDLKWMRRELKDGEIYAFDLFISPEFRGSPLTIFFIGSYLMELKKMNFLKIYGCFFTDNIPSLWVHRIFSYNEIGKVMRHRFFCLEIKNKMLCLS
jgi:hypothetical protein